MHRPTLIAALVLPLVFVLAALTITPVPGAIVLRMYYDKFAAATSVETDHYAASAGITQQLDLSYSSIGGAETEFDLFRPRSANTEPLPTVVWLHGGGWLGGEKDALTAWARKIASSRFNVVVLNYPLAPEHPYPAALTAIDQAMSYLKASASLYHLDANQFILAGDSAGANLASQYAALVSNPSYATTVGLNPALAREELRGVVLAGGLYDTAAVAQLTGLTRLTTQQELWAYTGSRDYTATVAGEQMSTVNAVTAEYPATWLTGGDADEFTATQSVPFASALKSLGVRVVEQFPVGGLPHEYQFKLGLSEARASFSSMLQFMHSVTQFSATR